MGACGFDYYPVIKERREKTDLRYAQGRRIRRNGPVQGVYTYPPEVCGMDKKVLKNTLISSYKLGLPGFIKAWNAYRSEYALLLKQKGGNNDFMLGKKYPVFTG